MKRLLYVVAFAIVVSTLIYQSTSYSNAGLKSEVAVSAVQDGQALISIHYGEGRQFWITNNTDQAVRISGSDFFPLESSSIEPARLQEFTIVGEPASLLNTVLTIEAEWQNGSALIDSAIPQSNVDVILLELVEEEILEVEEEVEIEIERDKEIDIDMDIENEIEEKIEMEVQVQDELEENEEDIVEKTQPGSE
ncbi:hypothetical protein QWT69_03015 [Sporosarcina oncorhynchi]|uniref:Uncharacterized protein n=1 Tax=Sporosarcina oncorhynchi TaxID=3056444 RepID=A0ABZ0L6I6_9BACL|nr:hypothetical protein [Sporosarcina sp. T2O-4]WOV88110.1 hypothetical protein QWT69_03015 [Sporosarcina sp. T2O-4]